MSSATRSTPRHLLLGRLGEDLAARFLTERGAVILGRNLRMAEGEVDLHVRFGKDVVAVEVKTVTASANIAAVDHFDDAKAHRVRSLCARLSPPASRVDLVAVTVSSEGVALRWLPGVG